MSIIQPTRSRPLDPLLLEDGLNSGSSSIPSVSLSFGQSPESAMVDEIFNNPDVWSVQFGEPDDMDSESAVNLGGLDSGSTRLAEGSTHKGLTTGRDAVHPSGSLTTIKKRRSKSARLPEGFHLKRRSKLQIEAFTLKPFESRHRVMPYLSSASSMSDSSSIASSTPSLNSSLPTISDEDSVRSQLKSVPLAPVRWRGMQDINEGPNDSLTLVALMEPSNNMSPEAGERMSILWSHQNIFRAFPTPKGVDYEFREGSSGSQSSAKSTGSTMEAVTSAFLLTGELGDSSQTGVMKPRRNVPPLTISTTTRMTTTTTTTVITVQSPARSSPASVTVVSASATWSILELYGDSPKPSPKFPKLPKTSGHLDRSFKSSDLCLPSRPPNTAFATNFPSQQSHAESITGIVELPADFVIPELHRVKPNPKLKGPRMSPPSHMKIAMIKDLDLVPLPEKEVTTFRNRKNGAVRPLPQVPRDQSSPPLVPALSTKTIAFPPQNSSPSPPSRTPKAHPPVSHSGTTPRAKKSALRSRMPPPPPLPLDSPLPPLPSDAVERLKTTVVNKADSKAVQAQPRIDLQKSKVSENEVSKVKETKKVSVNVLKVKERAVELAPDDSRVNQRAAVPQLFLLPPESMGNGTPARPSRKDVISPLPSPLLERLRALESLPGKKVLSPPVSAHKPSASESSPRSAERLSMSPGPPATSWMKRGLRKSASISSMSRLTPEFQLPDASILAKRFRKDPAGEISRPPLEPTSLVAVSPPDVQARLTLPTQSASTSIPSVSTSQTLVLHETHNEIAVAQAPSNELLLYPAKKVKFPSLDRNLPPFTNLLQQAPVPKDVFVPRSLPTHRKGTSLNSLDAKPVLKVHKKSSSAVAFKVPVVEQYFPDAATLAKRLAARKHSNAAGHKQIEDIFEKDLISESKGLAMFSSASDPKQHRNESSELLPKSTALKLSNGEDRNHTPAIPRPSHMKNASTSVLHQKTPRSKQSLKKVSSHSSLRGTGAFSSTLDSNIRSHNGSISIRGAHDVPLPDASVLAQRMKLPSALSGRPYGDVSDAFTPSTMSAVVDSPALSQMRLGQDNIAARVPLAASEPVVTTASWASQLNKQISDSPSPPTQAQVVAKIARSGSDAPSHSRSRSESGAKGPNVSLPPLPIHATPRESPALKIPKRALVSRTPSPGPGILIRDKAASPAPTLSLHVHFQPIQKHHAAAAASPVKDESTKRGGIMLNHAGNSRGRQPPTTRGRSASVLSPSKETGSSQRSASAVAFSRNYPLPPLPVIPVEDYSSDSPASAGSRGRISPFPSRPVSRASTITASVS
ncbi:hypothetical protein GGU11DRAFT_744809 [Lentinula aff. detonsa]|nr:hypothetical protein GGU11DRAFT_744809 [Lentinula aff. detonsa]